MTKERLITLIKDYPLNDCIAQIENFINNEVEFNIKDRVAKALQKMDEDHAEKLIKIVDALQSHFDRKIRTIEGDSKNLKYDHHGSEPSSEFVIPDECCGDDLALIEKIDRIVGEMKNRPIVYIDMDGVLANFDKAHKEQYDEKSNPFPQSRVHFFYDLEEIEGSNHAVRELNKLFNIRIATAPSVKNPLCYTEKRQWIEKHYGDINLQDQLYIIPDKSVLIGDYLIDDNICAKNGQANFKGELIHFGSKEYKDWNSVLDHFYFLDKAKSKC